MVVIVPRCPRCGSPHLASLPCWRGRYATRLTRLTLSTYGTSCWLCTDTDAATTADHVLPRSRGGSDHIDNLRPAHRRCNSARGNRLVRKSRRVESNDASSSFFSGEGR